jgi:hypothetical protein
VSECVNNELLLYSVSKKRASITTQVIILTGNPPTVSHSLTHSLNHLPNYLHNHSSMHLL